MMINTTTIPTQMNEFTWTDMFTSYSTWFIFSMGIIEIVMHYVCKNNGAYDEDEDEEDEEEKYTDKYVDEFKALTRRELTKEEMVLLKTKIVRETMPDDNVVVMTYDIDLECFCYYTDHLKDVNYNMLETIARKYAIEYDCKFICVEAADDADATDDDAADDVADDDDAHADEPVVAEAEPKSVFAKFKKYNTGGKGAAPNFNPPVNVIEQSNHFRFKGKLCDYEEYKGQEDREQKSKNEPVLDYANYKNLLEKKDN